MGALREKDRKELEKIFAELVKPVKLLMFTQERECQYCETTRQILEEVAAISDKIALEVHDFAKEAELAAGYGVDKIPALIVMGERDHGIRFYGVPAGYEFSTLVEDIVDVSRGAHGLPDEVVEELRKVDQPVRMEVMVTPT